MSYIEPKFPHNPSNKAIGGILVESPQYNGLVKDIRLKKQHKMKFETTLDQVTNERWQELFQEFILVEFKEKLQARRDNKNKK